MNRRHLLIPVVGILLSSQACQKREVPDTRATDEQAIRDLEKEWSQAAAAKDVDRLVSFYADDALVSDPNHVTMNGKDAIRTGLTQFFATPGVSLSSQTVKVVVVRNGDLAYTHGTYMVLMNNPKGGPLTDRGSRVTVYKKQLDGKWKAVADMCFGNTRVVPRELADPVG